MYFTDVTLRDGLQMESTVIAVDKKLELLQKLAQLKPNRIEITSFVNPKWVPQFQDAEKFSESAVALKGSLGVEFMAFVPNVKGLERLLAYEIDWVSAFVATSETFNKKNVNTSIDETLKELAAVIKRAKEKGRKARIYISTVFGCPYEGKLDDAHVQSILAKVAALNPDEIALSDTIGVAIPSQVKRIVGDFAKSFGQKKTALHLHNTYGLAVACAQAGYDAGIQSFDGSTGGVGGCPYAKGATGNVALEELRYLFTRQGADSAWDAAKIFEVTSLLEGWGMKVHSKTHDIVKKGGTIHGIG